jgi:hypothetical protein
VDYYWNFQRSQTNPQRKFKVILNLVSNEDDEKFFSEKTGLTIRERSNKYYAFSFFNEKYDIWDQQNIIDIYVDIESVLKKFKPPLFIGE